MFTPRFRRVRNNSRTQPTSFRRRPSLEVLEDRITPAVFIEIGIDLDGDNALDDVRVTGSTENTFIHIADEGAGTSGSLIIDVDKNGDGIFGPSDVQDFVLVVNDDTCVIELNLGDGNDKVEYALTDNLRVSKRDWLIDLGGGQDTFAFDANNKNIEASSVANLELVAGAAKDIVEIEFASVTESSVSVDATMAGGSDQLDLVFSQSGGAQIDTGASVQIDIDLGGGNNNLFLSLNCDVGATGQGTLDIEVVGGNVVDQVDEVSVVLNTESGNDTDLSRLSLDVALNDGPDILDIVVPLVEIHTNSLVAISGRGGLGDDSLDLRYAQNLVSIISAGAVLDVEFSSGAGNDSVTVSLTDIATPRLELLGLFRLQITGNDGNDELRSTVKVTGASAGTMDIGILAGVGNDTVTYNFLKGSSTVALAPTGKARLNGGKGIDTLDTISDAALVDGRMFETFI